MFFYCTGGLLWYSLLYRSRSIPSVIPAFGLAAVSLGLVGVVLQLLGNTVPIVAYLPLLPFELTLGTWLLVKGIKGGSETSTAQPREWSLHAFTGGTR
jgi:ABC-type glucose/galactose transport system permease subunit